MLGSGGAEERHGTCRDDEGREFKGSSERLLESCDSLQKVRFLRAVAEL